MSAQALKRWAKAGRSPLARRVFTLAKALRGAAMPSVPAIHAPLYAARIATLGALAGAKRSLWTTPLLKSRIETPAPGLYVYGGMPLILGNLRIRAGRDVRISGQTTISGRASARATPLLDIGSNVDIGWQTTIAVAGRIVIGDNVRIAGRAFLAGYPGHPLDPADRAAGLPETDDQCGDIVLERDVWLATGVTVLPGVTIGQGTVVGAGSVVTKDLPPFVLAAGSPARVVRTITPKERIDVA